MDDVLDVCQRDEVERGDPFVQSIDNLNKFGVRDGPIHIVVALGEVAIEVADEYLRLGNGDNVRQPNSLPAPCARPRIAVMVTAGDLLSRMSASIYGCSPGGGLHPWQIKLVSSEIPVVDDKIRVGAVEPSRACIGSLAGG